MDLLNTSQLFLKIHLTAIHLGEDEQSRKRACGEEFRELQGKKTQGIQTQCTFQ